MSSSPRRNFDYHRTNSICPTPESLLLDYVKNNDLNKIQILIEANPNLLTHIYDHPYDKPIIQIACREPNILPETIQLLIDLGSELNGTVHLATENKNTKILEIIIKNLSPGQINELVDGNNALHYLIKYCDEIVEKEQIECVKILLRAGIDINQTDCNGLTAVLLAAKKINVDLVKVLIENSVGHIDLDNHKLRNKSARDLIISKELYNPNLLPEKVRITNLNPKEKLFTYIKQSNEFDFIKSFDDSLLELLDADNGESTLLQISCERGLTKIIKHLLDKGADVNLITSKNCKAPITLTAQGGYYEIFSDLLNHPRIQLPNQIICDLLKNIDNDKIQGIIDHENCYQQLLKKLKTNPSLIDINYEDKSKNTPLHYSIRYAGEKKTLELLELGASLACKNDFNVMPIEDIEPMILRKHLDNCIKFNLNSKNLDKQDFEITFDYHTLIPPKRIPDNDEENCNHFRRKDFVTETEVIAYMSRAPEFKHLLKHPLIVTFLFMKWYRIYWLFFTNLCFYILFVLSLVIYIFSFYGHFNHTNHIILTNLSWIVLCLTFILLVLRELFQIAVSSKKYFKNFENYIEIILIIITAMILFIQLPSDDTRKQLSAIAILLSAFELVLMLGQHPKLSTNVVMLRTVSFNFFKFLLWYSLLILAFALSFYILFTQSHPTVEDNYLNQSTTITTTTTSTTAPNSSGANKDNEEEEDNFLNPGKSIFKTIIMLTGEFDASSINFNTYPITSKLIFALFIFMIVIILLNLLNGLAVSDTQIIKDDAELVGHIVRAQHIYYVEVMLLGNILPTNLLRMLNNFCCCLPIHTSDFSSYTLTKPLVKQICLFPKLFHDQVTILPNNQGQIILDNFRNQKNVKKSCWWSCRQIYLDKENIRRINDIIQEKRDESKGVNKEIERDEIIKQLQIEQINIRNKLDIILRLLSQNNNV